MIGGDRDDSEDGALPAASDLYYRAPVRGVFRFRPFFSSMFAEITGFGSSDKEMGWSVLRSCRTTR